MVGQPDLKRRGRRLHAMTSLSSNDRLPGLTVVLPCFNEAPNIAQAIREATSAAAWAADDVEVVVVDDGSTDGTALFAADAAAGMSHVRIVEHDRNRGYGAALVSGLRAARMPWVLLTDADLQFDLDQLERFLPLAPDADLVLGWRIERQDPLHRRLNAAAWNRLVRRAFGLEVRDVDCAFKLVRRDLVQDIPLTSTGAMISTELVVRAKAQGARIAELGVEHRPRIAGEQSGASPRVVLRAFRELSELRHELATEARPPLPAPTTPAAA
jgi:glycosyltransferase involved in cell wall biosynthesis